MKRFLHTQYVIAIISCVVIAVSVVFAKRRPFFFPIETQLYFASVLAVLWGLFVAGWIIAKRRVFDVPQLLREAWPLLLYYALSMALLVVVLLRAHFSSAILHMTFNYWALYPAVPLAWFMARAGGKQTGKMMPVFMLVLTSLGFVLCLGQLFQALGFTNPIGNLLVWFHKVNLPLDSWVWTPREAIRLTGYSFDPNYFAVFVLTGIAWALCGRDRVTIRAVVLAQSTFMLFFSASRGVLLALVIVVIAWAIIYRRWLLARLRGAGRVALLASLGVVVVVVVGAGAYMAQGHVPAMMSRVGSSVSEIQQHGLTAKSLDVLSNGRGELWVDAIHRIKENPLGSWLVERQLSAKSYHNDYLVALLTGGPLMLIALIVLLVWMWRRKTASENRALPVLLALICALTSFFYNIFQFGAVLPLIFFLLGVYTRFDEGVHAY